MRAPASEPSPRRPGVSPPPLAPRLPVRAPARPGGRSWLRAALPVALLVLAAAGCTAMPDRAGSGTGTTTAAATSTAAALPDGVSVRVYQTRFDYADRVLELSIANAGPAPLDLRSARFESSRFTAAAVWADRLQLEPGMTRDLRVRLAGPVCTDSTAETSQATPPAPTDTLTLAWALPGGGTASATVPAADDSGALDRIEGEDCLADALKRVVRIEVAPELRVDGAGPASVAWLDLSLTPTGAPGTVTVDQVRSTPLLASADGIDWPIALTLAATAPPSRISLGLRPARCDPHGIAEDKRGTVFSLSVRVTAGPGALERTGDWDLAVSPALRARLYAWIAENCGY